MTKYIVLVSKEHPLFDKVTNDSDIKSYVLGEDDFLNSKDIQKIKSDYLFDLTTLKTENKRKLIKFLNMQIDHHIISDLSTNWAESLHGEFESLVGSCALCFHSPRNTYEIFVQNDEAKNHLSEFLSHLNLNWIQVSNPGIGFHFPRTLSMIINEAYFSLEEDLASKEDIDTAMKFGVNYPLGPFEWAEKIGTKNIVHLLDELFEITKDSRYKASCALRMESNL